MTPIILSANTLYQAFRRAQKAASWKANVQCFEMDFLHQIALLQKELTNQTYKTGHRTEFVLRERGKTRLIRNAPFRDKVVRHAFCDNVLVPALKRKLIHDNGASIEGKGVQFSRQRLKTHLHRYFRQHGNNDGYILLMDFSSFYDNIRHDKLLALVEPYLSDYYKWLLRLILKDFRQDVSFLNDEEIQAICYGKYKALDYVNIPNHLKTQRKFLEKSVDIGDQCSQILGVYFPTKIDQFIKTIKREKFYGRYMDDSYIIADNRQRLIELLKDIQKIAHELGIILNPRKIRIVKISRTFQFLQNKYFLTETGKVVERLNPKRVTEMRRKLKKLFALSTIGKASVDAIKSMFDSWRGTHYPLMSRQQRNQMTQLFFKLLRGK